MRYCLDTNAILDLCYRYYPQAIFANVWRDLHHAIIAKVIIFSVSAHVYDEVYLKAQHLRYDTDLLDTFFANFKVIIIPKDNYHTDLNQLQKDILAITSLKSTTIDKDINDLSNLSIAKGATVITSEQGTGQGLDKTTKRLKIPDTCQHFNIPCSNWLVVFHFIGLKP